MIGKRLFWQFYGTYLLITFIVLLAVSLYTSHSVRERFLEKTDNDLAAQARFIRSQIDQAMDLQDYDRIDLLCKKLRTVTDAHITVVLPDGKVVADSKSQPWIMENLLGEPEIMQAESGRTGTDTRLDALTEQKMRYVAVPFESEESRSFIIRMAIPLEFVDKELNAIYWEIIRIGVIIAIISAILSLVVSKRISKPIEKLRRGADMFAQGKLAIKLQEPRSEELAGLARAMNKMSSELDERIQTITRARNELEAILSSMAEGVIAVDADGYIVTINRAACELLEIDGSIARGRSIEEAIRDVELQEFVKTALTSEDRIQKEIERPDHKTQALLAYGRVIRLQEQGSVGAIVVLNNLTHVRWLENVRREFVANVSHELKTPITSIKGFVETLLDGAIEKRDEAIRFLKIIARHTNRLNAIIEDILILSRIEDESEKEKIPRDREPIRNVIDGAVETCYLKSNEKQIDIKVNCPEIEASINSFMLEQALVNIIDNAIKYSDPHTTILVSAHQENGEVRISVKDHGYGISREHLDRIFERFYVTDKARSRKLGGTGLGLAIVKHIAQAHDGYVTVHSEIGKGTTFTIHLPYNGTRN